MGIAHVHAYYMGKKGREKGNVTLKVEFGAEALEVARVRGGHEVAAVHHDERAAERVPEVVGHVALSIAAVKRKGSQKVLQKSVSWEKWAEKERAKE